MHRSSLANDHHPPAGELPTAARRRRWLTTVDVAQRLDVSRRYVRLLVDAGDLACENETEAGAPLFLPEDVARFERRRERDRAALVTRRLRQYAALRAPLLTAAREPRQLALHWAEPVERLRFRLLIGGGERARPTGAIGTEAEVKVEDRPRKRA